MSKFAIIGAGFSGATLATMFASAGHHVDVFEAREHVAGNCHTVRDLLTGVLVHVYGPHIFHTDNERVWSFVQSFGDWIPYTHRVKAVHNGKVYPLPINLMLINQFFGRDWSPNRAREYIDVCQREKHGRPPETLEEFALSEIGPDLYRAFFKGYTEKQWGVDPKDLPASVLKRLPIRYSYDDRYFEHPHQALPKYGYTDIVEQMLDRSRIQVHVDTKVDESWLGRLGYDHTFYSGPLDEWFGFKHGPLGYRTLDFEVQRADGDVQGAPVINYCDLDVPHTRITEFKHFTPWEKHPKTITYRETSRACLSGKDIPYYPIRLVNDKASLALYQQEAAAQSHTTFVGRLGTYRYLDMDATIAESLEIARKFM